MGPHTDSDPIARAPAGAAGEPVPSRRDGDGAAFAPAARRAGARRATASSARPRVSRSEQLQQDIKDLIVARGLAAGDPLPTEFELVDELGVSRNSLREALKALQAVGIVEIRHGFGMYVGRMSLDALVTELAFHSRITRHNDHRDLSNVIYIREVLESGLVQRLVTDHPDADLSDVAEVVEQMQQEALVGAVSPETDRRFHQVLYRPLGNPLVAQLLGAFWDVYFQLRDDIAPPAEQADDVVRRHRDIYTAVRAGDPGAAQSAMIAHFDGVRRRLPAAVNDGSVTD